MIRKALVAGLFWMAATAPALATDGSSGCGPAWYVFKENSLASSALRITTNGTLFPSTTLGMTFGTSNCAPHKLVDKQSESVKFANLAYHELIVQMAQGSGEHLAAFAHTLGCSWQVQDTFNASLQANYELLVPSADAAPEAIVGGVLQLIDAQPSLKAQCSAGVG